MEGPGCNEQDVIRFHGAVFGGHRAAFDQWQQVALNTFARDIGTTSFCSTNNFVDFIKKYIFPGGFLPSVSAMSESIGKHTDMKLFHLQDIGPHYAKTLQHWRENFFNKLEEIRGLGYSEEFIRLWEYYFCYCEGGFLERDIGTVQMLLTRPENRRSPVML